MECPKCGATLEVVNARIPLYHIEKPKVKHPTNTKIGYAYHCKPCNKWYIRTFALVEVNASDIRKI